jgi:hypothetical protein
MILSDKEQRSATSRTTGAATTDQREALVKEAIGTIQMKPDWEQINFTKADPYSLTLYYRNDPSLFDVETDTTSIARSVFSEIVASGQKPGRLYVYAERRQVGVYGYVSYSPRDDGFHFCLGPPSMMDDSKCHRVPGKKD